MNTFSSKNTSEQIKKRIKDTLENVGLSNIIVEVRKVKNKKKKTNCEICNKRGRFMVRKLDYTFY